MRNALEDWESFPETRPARITNSGVGGTDVSGKGENTPSMTQLSTSD